MKSDKLEKFLMGVRPASISWSVEKVHELAKIANLELDEKGRVKAGETAFKPPFKIDWEESFEGNLVTFTPKVRFLGGAWFKGDANLELRLFEADGLTSHKFQAPEPIVTPPIPLKWVRYASEGMDRIFRQPYYCFESEAKEDWWDYQKEFFKIIG